MYLLDTCAFLWFLDDNPSLSKRARDIIGRSNDMYLSVASLWEIAIKKAIHKLDLDESIVELEMICNQYGIVILPIKIPYLERIGQLSMIHGDPFDRLIIATALEEGLSLITHDSNIRRYEIDLIWYSWAC